MSAIATQRLAINEPAVVSETIDGEVVVINLDKGAYYSLRDSAAFIWGLVQEGARADELTAALQGRYDGEESELRGSTQQFLAQLIDEELVKPAPSDSQTRSANGGDGAARFGRAPFVAPALEKYTDMEHLLLLDPIHDVDETGWPNAR